MKHRNLISKIISKDLQLHSLNGRIVKNNMKQFKKEKDFQSWYGKMLKDKGHIYHKISDMSL